MDILNLYCKIIIKPIEEERNKMRACYYSKNIFKRLNRKIYKEFMDKYDELLLEKYKKVGELINDYKWKFYNL